MKLKEYQEYQIRIWDEKAITEYCTYCDTNLLIHKIDELNKTKVNYSVYECECIIDNSQTSTPASCHREPG